ncbi:hypothetical protein M407DRAFT_227980 [Tulasnella calospora MUT 4182]|uniref:Uncharacterized protein n=1 Tax=Tulasnella calospora MUT 4182 TaxID=1051891 RepID=A0A0C3Q3G4_9AGAM|nr:hypothetical protein M407DRAFT_227980 [Tulasnella calospora MUT 4182]
MAFDGLEDIGAKGVEGIGGENHRLSLESSASLDVQWNHHNTRSRDRHLHDVLGQTAQTCPGPSSAHIPNEQQDDTEGWDTANEGTVEGDGGADEEVEPPMLPEERAEETTQGQSSGGRVGRGQEPPQPPPSVAAAMPTAKVETPYNEDSEARILSVSEIPGVNVIPTSPPPNGRVVDSRSGAGSLDIPIPSLSQALKSI